MISQNINPQKTGPLNDEYPSIVGTDKKLTDELVADPSLAEREEPAKELIPEGAVTDDETLELEALIRSHSAG